MARKDYFNRSMMMLLLLAPLLMTGCSDWGGMWDKNSDAPYPALLTEDAENVTAGTATLKGIINPYGVDTKVFFYYYTGESSLGIYAAATPSGVSADKTVEVQAAITGLASKTTYHFMVIAASVAHGYVGGNELSFTTL
jgi:hypothetical protein